MGRRSTGGGGSGLCDSPQSTIRIAHASSTAEQPIRIVVVVATCMILWYVPPVTGSMWSGDVSVCLVLLNAGLSLNLTKVFSSPRVSQKACGSEGGQRTAAATTSSSAYCVGPVLRAWVREACENLSCLRHLT